MKMVTVRRTGAYGQKKSTGIVADTVANVSARLLTYQWPKMSFSVTVRSPEVLEIRLGFLLILALDISETVDTTRYVTVEHY